MCPSKYRIAEIRRRHWNALARDNAPGSDSEAVMQGIAAMAPAVIKSVETTLPSEFPAAVSVRIFDGLIDQARRFKAGRGDC